MVIQELTRQESLDMLARTRLGRLACAQGNQPYVVPLYFALSSNYLHAPNCLYGFSTVGQKIAWMRANPLVSVEVEEVVSSQQWVSVIVSGRYEELPDTPEWQSEREFAWSLLKQHAAWWEPGYARTILHGTERAMVPVFFRIHVERITGHRATPDKPMAPPGTRRSMTDLGENGWLRTTLRRVVDRFHVACEPAPTLSYVVEPSAELVSLPHSLESRAEVTEMLAYRR